MAREWVTSEGAQVQEDGEEEYTTSDGFQFQEDQAAAVAAAPTLRHPIDHMRSLLTR